MMLGGLHGQLRSDICYTNMDSDMYGCLRIYRWLISICDYVRAINYGLKPEDMIILSEKRGYVTFVTSTLILSLLKMNTVYFSAVRCTLYTDLRNQLLTPWYTHGNSRADFHRLISTSDNSKIRNLAGYVYCIMSVIRGNVITLYLYFFFLRNTGWICNL